MQQSKDVLVTGGRGFVGSTLVRLLSKGRPVRVLDSMERSSPTGWEESDATFLRGDIRDETVLRKAVQGVDTIVHLAAYGSVIESINDPVANFHANVIGTFNVLHAAADAGVRRVVFASTGGALIGDATPPVNEKSLPKPISPYGASKLCGEAYCHAFAKSRALGAVCLRFGNVYGPHSAHKKGAVTMFIKALMMDQPIVIHGDGSASRDYIHVQDLSAGIESAIGAPLQGGEVFHIASGRETTVLELARLLCKAAGKPDHPIEFKSARTGEVARNFANYELAHEVLGFQPRHDLEAGLAATWNWFVEHRDIVLGAQTSDS